MDFSFKLEQSTTIMNCRQSSFKLSHDGRRLAVYYWFQSKPIKVFDTETGQCLVTLVGHDLSAQNRRGVNGVSNVLFSSDNLFLYSCAHDNTVKYWNIATGECLRTTCHLCEIKLMSISPDGTTIATTETSQLGDHIHAGRLKVYKGDVMVFEKTTADTYEFFRSVNWGNNNEMYIALQTVANEYTVKTYTSPTETDGSTEFTELSTFSTKNWDHFIERIVTLVSTI